MRAIGTVEYPVKIKRLDTYDAPFIRVHRFYLKLVNKVLYGQKHCLLPIENSENQPQQAKARTAQKSSNLTEKVRHLQDIFRYLQVKCTPCKPLTLYCTCLTLADATIS